MEGLHEHFVSQIHTRNIAAQGIQMFTKSMRNIFDFLYDLLKGEDINKPLTSAKVLFDPNNTFVQLFFYLYSIEPPLYHDLNQASIAMDLSKLSTLGPYARVIFQVLESGSKLDKNREDAMRLGEQDCDHSKGSTDPDSLKPTGPLGFFSQSFITYRGVKV